jgi:hypothetical protein
MKALVLNLSAEMPAVNGQNQKAVIVGSFGGGLVGFG